MYSYLCYYNKINPGHCSFPYRNESSQGNMTPLARSGRVALEKTAADAAVLLAVGAAELALKDELVVVLSRGSGDDGGESYQDEGVETHDD